MIMTGSLLAIIGIVFFICGYLFYSRFLAKKLFKIYDNIEPPSKKYNDGKDYVPTSKHILFGHHFTSIAGLAPILGPCIAICWGWLPVFLWIVLGTVFIGAVHDFGALVISVKEKGRSVADLAEKTINNRVRIMFLLFVIILSWLVLAIFTNGIASLFTKNISGHQAVIPINIEIILSIFMGYYIHKTKKNPLIPSIIALAVLYLSIIIGIKFPIELSINFWIYFLFIYAAIASILPVWQLLQPRDFINSHQLILALSLIFLSIIFSNPPTTIPMIQSDSQNPSIFPFLFITVACGAISGFHGLVSSGTTSKQVKNLKDTRLIGYGAMLGEGSLALATTIAATCGIGLYIGINPDSHSHDLSTFSSAANLKLDTFPNSVAALLYHSIIDLFSIKNNSIELFNGLRTFVIIVMISFAATTLDSATRICRFMIKELGEATKINFLKNKYAGTLFSIFPALMLLIIEVDGVSLGKFLWPLFGASNQMLAALTLMILVFYFNAKGIKNFLILGPMIFISFICISSFVLNFKNHTINHHLVLIIINSILLTLIFWLIAEAFYHYKKTTVKK